MKIGFDNEKYLTLQAEQIRRRRAQFGDKLYLEFGGKLFDDYHAARVLPGFQPDSKLRMLSTLRDEVELVIAIRAADIETSKLRGDLGISYGDEVLRLTDVFRELGFYVGSVVVTQYAGQPAADAFLARLTALGVKCYRHYPIAGYPSNPAHIVSEAGLGRNDYIETSRPIVVVTAPGPGSGKMATCLSQLYHEHRRGIRAGYAKYETFPIWNLPLDHPVNLAYEAATADLNDVNMLDPYHWKAYGVTTVNYNRDVEIFPVLHAIFLRIYGSSPYASPTDMGVNMAGNCIFDDAACREASDQEIIRRYFQAVAGVAEGRREPGEVQKILLLLSQEGLTPEDRPAVPPARQRAEETGAPAVAIELSDGRIITGKTTDLLGASSAALVNAIKVLAGIPHEQKILSPAAIAPIQELKTKFLGSKNPRLHTDEVLIALSATAADNDLSARALHQLPALRGCQVHSSVLLSAADQRTFQKLGCDLTCDPTRV